jgi:hypothetical protein
VKKAHNTWERLSLSVWPPRALLGFLAVLSLAVGLDGGLNKGQVIKQFFAYSITRSVAQAPFSPLETSIPCSPPRRFVEEPPVFHYLSAPWVPVPFMPSWLSYLAFLCLTFLLFQSVFSVWKPADHLWATLAVGSSPILLRYSFQHIPDLLATTFLLAGLYWLSQKKSLFLCVAFFTLAVTTKALTLFAVVPLVVWFFLIQTRRIADPKAWFRAGIVGLIVSAPFLGWIVVIESLNIDSPFDFSQIGTNRHSGDWSRLLTFDYLRRFFLWNFIKGIGLPLTAGFVVLFFRRRQGTLPGWLWLWGLFVVVYWLLVRQGNFVHDYYSLPFFFPLAVMGTAGLQAKRGLLQLAAMASVLISSIGLLGMSETPVDPELGRPNFCSIENP